MQHARVGRYSFVPHPLAVSPISTHTVLALQKRVAAPPLLRPRVQVRILHPEPLEHLGNKVPHARRRAAERTVPETQSLQLPDSVPRHRANAQTTSPRPASPRLSPRLGDSELRHKYQRI